MTTLLNHKGRIIKALIVLGLLWLTWGFWVGLIEGIAVFWAWRPASVIGAAMIVFPILAAIPTHYYLNVRRRNTHGMVEVTGFADYLGHGTLNVLVTWLYCGSIFAGIFILLFGFDIR